MAMVYYLNLGGNLGDARATIAEAAKVIAAQPWCRGVWSSDFFGSVPWGYDSVLPYLNLGLRIEADLSPLALLEALQEIERSVAPCAHRDAEGGYIDRALDIDIIAAEGMRVSMSQLSLPHPRAHLRDFVMFPLLASLPGD